MGNVSCCHGSTKHRFDSSGSTGTNQNLPGAVNELDEIMLALAEQNGRENLSHSRGWQCHEARTSEMDQAFSKPAPEAPKPTPVYSHYSASRRVEVIRRDKPENQKWFKAEKEWGQCGRNYSPQFLAH